MMKTVFGSLHLAAGFLALAAFWFPLFLRKGSRLHRVFGWVFVGGMSVILFSAATMTVERIAAGNRDFALFLAFLTLITSFAVWSGVTVLRHKNDPGWLRSPLQLVILIVIVAAGIGLLWQWYQTRFPLLLVFGLVGLVIGGSDLAAWRRPARPEPHWWWHQHLASMIVAGMAAHIAFLAFGATRIWPDLYAGQPWWLMLLPWVAPFPVAFAAIALLQRHYRRKFADTPGGAATSVGSTLT